MLEKEQNKILTVPNILSTIRLLMIPPTAVLLWHLHNTAAATLCIIAGLIDIADGTIARRFNQKSELGKVLDPLADKLFVAMLVIVLLLQARMPIWYAVVVLGRDLLIMLGGVLAARRIKIVLPSNMLGKLTALSVSLSMVIAVLDWKLVFTIFMYLSVILIVASLINYASIMFKEIKAQSK